MKVLVDAHALLWFIEDDARLSARARSILQDNRSELVFSVVAAWEIVLKVGRGKLDLRQPVSAFIRRHIRIMQMRVLPVRLRHVLRVAALPSHHADPFDRILVAQSQCDEIPILTNDEQLGRYPVQTIW